MAQKYRAFSGDPNGSRLYRGLLSLSSKYPLHLDYCLISFNDVDLACYQAMPIISPELNLKELSAFKTKDFIVQVHGDVVLMTLKERLRAPELVDDEGRHFRVRHRDGFTEVLNANQLGLFTKVRSCLDHGLKYFYIDVMKDAGKFTRMYRSILAGKAFDDRRIRKGYTTGHMLRGVA